MLTLCSDITNDKPDTVGSYIEFYFNEPGTNEKNGNFDPYCEDVLISILNSAKSTIDVAAMGFGREDIIDTLVRAHYRGIRVRFVGDYRHFEYREEGYSTFLEHKIPFTVGNQLHIMHDKFFVIDNQIVYTGTGNITNTGFTRNNNNYVMIRHPGIAQAFTNEFEQMFNGKFGYAKQRVKPIDTDGDYINTYQVGDTKVEVYFSPQDQAMGKIMEYVNGAQSSINFFIFAFTKDQLGGAFIEKHFDPSVEVRGVLDRSQVHGNGPYHEVYRMALNGLNLRMDSSENSRTPGDYQAGGGRLHCKTMIVDAGTPNAKVITGSFNWSNAATIANDETLLILHGERATKAYMQLFDYLWRNGISLPGDNIDNSDGLIKDKSIMINEVHWDGWNDQSDPNRPTDDIYDDEFIELKNMTDKTIDISLWSVSSKSDVVVGFPPATFIKPGQKFLVLDHNVVPFNDFTSQVGYHAFKNGDYVLNTANDPRFPRLNIKDYNLELYLKDNKGNVIDRCGDGGRPFWGGREYQSTTDTDPINYSMERRADNPGDGTLRENWQRCQLTEGGANVNDEYKSFIVASPGEENSIP